MAICLLGQKQNKPIVLLSSGCLEIICYTSLPSLIISTDSRHQLHRCRTVGLVANTCIVNCCQPTNQYHMVNIIVGTSALGHIASTSAFSLITLYMGTFLRRLPSSQPSWWGNVLIPISFPFDLSPVSSRSAGSL